MLWRLKGLRREAGCTCSQNTGLPASLDASGLRAGGLEPLHMLSPEGRCGETWAQGACNSEASSLGTVRKEAKPHLHVTASAFHNSSLLLTSLRLGCGVQRWYSTKHNQDHFMFLLMQISKAAIIRVFEAS